MGEVVEVGTGVKNLKVGDRVVVPFPDLVRELLLLPASRCSRCARTPTRTRWMAEKMCGHSPAGIFGYSHLLGGYAGGQAEYARVPFADVGPIKIPDGFTDEQVLFLSDIFPTGYMARGDLQYPARRHDGGLGLRAGGPVRDQERFPARSGACHRDRPLPERLRMAAKSAAPRPSTTKRSTCCEALEEMTGGRGPDACIDAVGMEAHAPGIVGAYDRVKQAHDAGDGPAASRCGRRSWPAATAARYR